VPAEIEAIASYVLEEVCACVCARAEWVDVSHMNDSCHISMSHVMRE